MQEKIANQNRHTDAQPPKLKKTCFPKIVFKNEISHTPQVYTVSTNLKKSRKDSLKF
jgi:hypothetical protein